MKRHFLFFIILLVLAPSAARSDGPGLTVHEFGVFTWAEGALYGVLDEEAPRHRPYAPGDLR